mmetsp:Transcript_36566/g.67214  ORF Transcript_36566/g.67214 Transcript_36566/m.67214 type:complete len:121 (-) Transcript_36566:74-436(-)
MLSSSILHSSQMNNMRRFKSTHKVKSFPHTIQTSLPSHFRMRMYTKHWNYQPLKPWHSSFNVLVSRLNHVYTVMTSVWIGSINANDEIYFAMFVELKYEFHSNLREGACDDNARVGTNVR